MQIPLSIRPPIWPSCCFEVSQYFCSVQSSISVPIDLSAPGLGLGLAVTLLYSTYFFTTADPWAWLRCIAPGRRENVTFTHINACQIPTDGPSSLNCTPSAPRKIICRCAICPFPFPQRRVLYTLLYSFTYALALVVLVVVSTSLITSLIVEITALFARKTWTQQCSSHKQPHTNTKSRGSQHQVPELLPCYKHKIIFNAQIKKACLKCQPGLALLPSYLSLFCLYVSRKMKCKFAFFTLATILFLQARKYRIIYFHHKARPQLVLQQEKKRQSRNSTDKRQFLAVLYPNSCPSSIYIFALLS